jgi:hypothetical protein
LAGALLRRLVVLAGVVAGALATAVGGGAGRAGAAAQHPWPGRQLLFFNHAYGVFDRTTADAIEHSDYLREFANFQVRTTTGAGGETWTGRYLLGHQTYRELFGIGDVPGKDDKLGAAGMGVSTEHAGDLATVTDRLPAEGVPDPVTFRQTRDFGDGVPMPCFDSVYTTQDYDTFGAWRGGTTIRFDAVPVEKVGVRRIAMSLNHPTGHRYTETIGHSTLVVGPGPAAVWTFAT